jgi:hypothetical protein
MNEFGLAKAYEEIIDFSMQPCENVEDIRWF